jgi:hypothetical protein
MLAERFPESMPPVERHWATGWAAVDEDSGGLRHGAVTELCSPMGCGRFFLDRMFASVQQRGGFAGLVDCGRTFDPGSYEPGVLARVLTVFCETAEQGMKVTDLLLRDGNLPLVLLDFQAMAPRQLGRIPMSTWHRFQRLVEQSGAVLLVLTPQPIVESARTRLVLRGRWDLAALKCPRRELMPDIAVQVFRRGKQSATSEEAPVRERTA